MKSDSEVVKVTTVPFLLELASRSDMLLQVLSTDLIKSCKTAVEFSEKKWNATCTSLHIDL